MGCAACPAEQQRIVMRQRNRKPDLAIVTTKYLPPGCLSATYASGDPITSVLIEAGE